MRTNGKQLQHKATAADLSQMIYGKVPPQAKALEEHVLGLMIYFPEDTILDAKQILKPEDFYVTAHQLVCKALYEMHDKRKPIELLLLVEHLREKGELDQVGGPYAVTVLTNSVVQNTNFYQYLRIIKQYAVARKLIHFSADVLNKAYSDDVFDSLDFAQQKLFEIFEEVKTNQVNDISAIAFNTIRATLEIKEDKDWVVTGFEEWDRINGQLVPGLYVIAARPGMGKTAFVVEMISRMAKKYPIAFINGEMSDEQMSRRFCSNLVEFNNELFKVPSDMWSEETRNHFLRGMQEFVNLNLYIYSDSQEITQVCNMIRYYVRKCGCKAIVLDFLQIMGLPEELAKYMNTDTARINHILKLLRELSKELKVPIFLLSQLNRESVKRGATKRPGLSDLKGSGTIEEYAFQISFLHRPEYYGEALDDMGQPAPGLCYQYIDKHRDGELKMDGIKHRFIGRYSKFEKYEDEYTAAGWDPVKAAALEAQDEEDPF